MTCCIEVSGRVLDIRRHLVPFDPGQPESSRERWELWIQTAQAERKIVIHSRDLPVRRGHRIKVALDGEIPVALVNSTTGDMLNIVRSNPPAHFLGRDVVPPIMTLFASLLVAAVGRSNAVFFFAIPLAVLYVPLRVMARYLSYQAEKARSDMCLAAILPAGQAGSAAATQEQVE